VNILSVEFFIAIRYLKTKKKSFFSSLAAFVAISGTTLGVAALVVTLAIMSGFQQTIRDKILSVQPHIVVTRGDGELFKNYILIENRIKANKSVVNVSPFIYKQGIIKGLKSETSASVVIKAINYKQESRTFNFSKQIIISDINFNNKNIGEKSIILGSELAKNIAVNAGDTVVLVLPESFSSIPEVYKFNVAAIVQFGIYDFDSSLVFIDLEEGQKLFSIAKAITGFDVHVKNFDKAVSIALQIQESLSYSFKAKAWIDMNKNLFSAMKLEKVMMFLILGLIIIVAAFNIISNLLLLSIQKSKEIGILSAVGFSKFSIGKIFFYDGFIIGFLGTIIGIVLGLTISFILKYFNIFKLPNDVYYVDKLPVSIIPSDIIMVAASAFIITILACIYPVYQISKLDPLEAIRYG
jgi:lipoprotein-releasing system permease protein